MISNTNNGEQLQESKVISRDCNEYRSETELFGLPLVQVARGIDPRTGFFRVAKGIIAIGDVAVGFLALGAITIGGFSTGLLFAFGGVAFSLKHAIGGLALAPHFIAANGIDKGFLQIIERWIPIIYKH